MSYRRHKIIVDWNELVEEIRQGRPLFIRNRLTGRSEIGQMPVHLLDQYLRDGMLVSAREAEHIAQTRRPDWLCRDARSDDGLEESAGQCDDPATREAATRNSYQKVGCLLLGAAHRHYRLREEKDETD
jgi:hypothetical protein